jgi:type I restriction-modification system DNA methylase subunit
LRPDNSSASIEEENFLDSQGEADSIGFMDTYQQYNVLTPAMVRPWLERCGYQPALLISDYRFGTPGGTHDVALAAFAHQPTDARSACMAVVSTNHDPAETALSYRELGAPVLFVCRDGELQWWSQRADTPKYEAAIPLSNLPGFFHTHQQDFAPQAVYRAKTWGRLEQEYQLTFVDAGLMPVIEASIGRALSQLVERAVDEVNRILTPLLITAELGPRLLQSIIWILAAKILKDKTVPTFDSLDLSNLSEVFSRVAAHYGASPSPNFRTRYGRKEREALEAVSRIFAQFSPLTHVTTESLAYVYENTLISKQTRANLAIHSTPAYLVDYIIWRLAPWIEEIPAEDRHVFEPACGHAGFLVSAMRLLKELLPTSQTGQASRGYLRERLHGIEIDAFALEIARLSMTLADIPNPDHWDLRPVDMFGSDTLEQLASESMVLLANPPFSNFTRAEKAMYLQQGYAYAHRNKAAEMLYQTLPHLRPGAVFGVVIPQGFLHSDDAASFRAFIAREFELGEICLFPDKIFTFSDMESAILVGRRVTKSNKATSLRYRRVREHDIERFKQSYTATTEQWVAQRRFVANADANMAIPDMEEVWAWCRYLPKCHEIVKIGKGLEYKNKTTLPPNTQTISLHPFPGAVSGFARISPALQIHGQPREVWMNINQSVIRRSGTGTTTGVPQVLLNHARVGRSPWRLKAVIDREGHAVTGRFLTLRPSSPSYPLDFVWAICNSPFANAYTYAHTMKRDVLRRTLNNMPVPCASDSEIQHVVEAVHAYFDAVVTSELNKAYVLLQMVDAAILRLYDLPPRLERQILNLFAGWKRPGIPFDFDRYFPEDFEPFFPLHVYLSEDYQRSTAGALRARHKPVTDPAILAALEHAIQTIEE